MGATTATPTKSVEFKTLAYQHKYPLGPFAWEEKKTVEITVTRDEQEIIRVNSRPVQRVMAGPVQLALITGERGKRPRRDHLGRGTEDNLFLIFDSSFSNCHHPPMPVKDMYAALCPEKAN